MLEPARTVTGPLVTTILKPCSTPRTPTATDIACLARDTPPRAVHVKVSNPPEIAAVQPAVVSVKSHVPASAKLGSLIAVETELRDINVSVSPSTSQMRKIGRASC